MQHLDIEKIIEEFPGLLYHLHSLPRDERAIRLERELHDGIAGFNRLLGELHDIVLALKVTVQEIKGLSGD